MGWLGKIIGGTVGFFLGGPMGMIAGAVFGHFIDKTSDLDSSETGGFSFGMGGPYFLNTGYDRTQMVFFVGAFSMLAKLSTADGPLNERAKSKINEFIVYDLNLRGQGYQYAVNIFNQALNNESITFESLADQFAQNFRSSSNILQLMMDIFFRIAMADGTMSKEEERLIDYAARVFGIPSYILESLRKKYGVGTGLEKSYATLGLSSNASEAEIKKAYRKLIMEFHPDAVAARGMAEEFKDYATKKFRETQEAYETICKERNIK